MEESRVKPSQECTLSGQEEAALRPYRSHKIVRAAKITGVEHAPDARMHLALDNGVTIGVSRTLFEKHEPRAGGYFVAYVDGYTSYSPAEPFEVGYTLVPPGASSQPSNHPVIAPTPGTTRHACRRRRQRLTRSCRPTVPASGRHSFQLYRSGSVRPELASHVAQPGLERPVHSREVAGSNPVVANDISQPSHPHGGAHARPGHC